LAGRSFSPCYSTTTTTAHISFFRQVTWDTAESHDKVPLIGHRVDLRADDGWEKWMVGGNKKERKKEEKYPAG
jgi:hypothetical protein